MFVCGERSPGSTGRPTGWQAGFKSNDPREPMIGKNRQLVTDEPVEFEK